MNLQTSTPVWLIYLVIATIAALLIWRIIKEVRQARQADAKEKTDKHFKAVLIQYGIIAGICAVAAVVVIILKDGPLAGLSESIWGKPTITPTLSPWGNP